MFGIESNQLRPIHDVLKKLEPNYNPEKLGAWGILFLCCGALAARNDLWRDRVRKSDIFICSSDMNNIIQGSDVCTSDDYAIRFSEFIKKWCNDSHAIAVANQRMEKFRNKFSEQNFINHKTYITLAYALNSFQDMGKKELLGFDCKTWMSMSSSAPRTYGWPELFFAAGIILNNETSVEWHKMASAINSMGKSGHVDIAALYEHYAGENPFTKKVHTKIRIDQLKKGTRIKLRSGWEAIVVKKSDGTTLIAEVLGDFTETGSIYAHDVVAAYIDGNWVEIEMTEEQSQSYDLVKLLNQRDALSNNKENNSTSPDLSKKSTNELVNDMFNIINEHIGEQRSLPVVSEEKNEVTTSKQSEAPAYGANNKIFTEEKANEAREILKKKLSGLQLKTDFSSDIFTVGFEKTIFYMSLGTRTFLDYSQKMIYDFGDAIRPYLKQLYVTAKYQPGMDKTGMSTEDEMNAIDVNAIDPRTAEYELEQRRGKTNNHYPKVNRGHFLSDPHEDISWAEGTLHDGRPFRIEYWYRSDSSFITVYISSLDIENVSEQELKDLLIKEGLIDFDDEKYLNSGFGGGINLTAKKFKDASDNEMWSLTVIVGDDDGTYVHTNVKFQKHTFPDKRTDPYIYTQEATDVENAEYFITLCEEQSKQGTASMYQGYFINNTDVPIEIMLELPPGTLSKIEPGSTVDSLVNNPPNNKWITQYTNIPAHSYVSLNMLYFDWEFDFSNARHLFLKTAGVEKHINFYMEKYFIRGEEIDCIPVLNRRGYFCLPSVSNIK